MKRTLLLGTAWTASAASAVGLGFLAVSLVDASASSGTVPLAATSSASAAAEPTASTAGPGSATKATPAGTVSASCTSGTPRLSGAPATGWWIDDSDDGKAAQVEFQDGSRKLEVSVTCVDGSPVFTVEGPRADSSGGDDTVAPAPATSDAPDDSDGRDGGGHGSDDPAGDDSAGRTSGGSDDSGSGGHGSDDSGSDSDSGGSDDSGGHGGGSGGHGSDD